MSPPAVIHSGRQNLQNKFTLSEPLEDLPSYDFILTTISCMLPALELQLSHVGQNIDSQVIAKEGQ